MIDYGVSNDLHCNVKQDQNMIKGYNFKYSYIYISMYELWFYFIPLYNSFVTNVLVYP